MLSKKAFAFILASCILWFYYTSVIREQSSQPASLRSSSLDNDKNRHTLHYTAPPAVSSATHEEQQSTTKCQYKCNDISTTVMCTVTLAQKDTFVTSWYPEGYRIA